jgi:hypothetical protein
MRYIIKIADDRMEEGWFQKIVDIANYLKNDPMSEVCASTVHVRKSGAGDNQLDSVIFNRVNHTTTTERIAVYENGIIHYDTVHHLDMPTGSKATLSFGDNQRFLTFQGKVLERKNLPFLKKYSQSILTLSIDFDAQSETASKLLV